MPVRIKQLPAHAGAIPSSMDVEIETSEGSFRASRDQLNQAARTGLKDEIDSLITKAEDIDDALDAANAAADRAAQGGIYESVEDALEPPPEGVPEGGFFSVPGDDENTFLILYRHDPGSVATELKRYPSSEYVRERLINAAPAGYDWGVVDKDGKAAVGLRSSDQALVAVRFESQFNQLLKEALGDNPEMAFVFEDGFGRVSGGIKKDGTMVFRKIEAGRFYVGNRVISLDLGRLGAGSYTANIVHIICYGQSLSVGATAYSPISTVQRFDNLMFKGGVLTQHPDDSSDYYGELVPLVESGPDKHEDGYLGGETPCSGAADMIKERILVENGIGHSQQQYQVLCSAPGDGGLSIAELSDGTTCFDALKDNITNGHALAVAAGKTYNVPAVLWAQGEQDNSLGTSVSSYKATLKKLREDIDTHAKLTTGQTNDVRLICYQLQRYLSHGMLVQKAIYEASLEDAHIHIATPMYFFDYSDAVHLRVQSSKWLGAYYGLAYKQIMVDEEEFSPVRPLSHQITGNILEVKFHTPVKPLVFDTDRVAAASNMGFDLFESDGVTPIVITDVSISQPDTVKFVTEDPVPAGAVLRYAYENGDGACSRFTGSRGNLRDSQGDYIRFDEDGMNLPMHNWCIVFEYTIS